MNLVVLMGRLTRDPEVRYSQGSDPICIAMFDLAVDRAFKGKDGKREADFFRVKVFGKQGEFVEKYITKGTKILVSGRLQQEHWKDNDGNNRTMVSVIADRIEFAESKAASDQGSQKPAKQEPDQDGFMNIPEGVDEELPFV